MKLIKQEIKISVLEIDDEEAKFLIEITNGTTSISLEFYSYIDDFKEFGKALTMFGKSINDIAKYEFGEESDKFAYYLLLKAYCYEFNGYSAIQIKVNNNKTHPLLNKSEFFITTIPSELNKLGQLLIDWNPCIEKVFIWKE